MTRFVRMWGGLVSLLSLVLTQVSWAGGGVPIAATEVAAKWDSLYWFLIWLSVFFFILVVGGMIVFAIKYRTRPGIKTAYITDNHILETIWIAIPTVLLLAIFGWGFWVYKKMIHSPSDALRSARHRQAMALAICL